MLLASRSWCSTQDPSQKAGGTGAADREGQGKTPLTFGGCLRARIGEVTRKSRYCWACMRRPSLSPRRQTVQSYSSLDEDLSKPALMTTLILQHGVLLLCVIGTSVRHSPHCRNDGVLAAWVFWGMVLSKHQIKQASNLQFVCDNPYNQRERTGWRANDNNREGAGLEGAGPGPCLSRLCLHTTKCAQARRAGAGPVHQPRLWQQVYPGQGGGRGGASTSGHASGSRCIQGGAGAGPCISHASGLGCARGGGTAVPGARRYLGTGAHWAGRPCWC